MDTFFNHINKLATMKKILFLMAMAIMVLGFTACTDSFDNPVFMSDVTLPKDAEFDDGAMLVRQWASEFTIDIAANGEWRIESDRRFLRPETKVGKGNATVTISVQENTSDDRKVGHLTIVFPGHEEQNKVITVEQEWYGDPVDNAADVIETNNIIYAVGYSYDCTEEYASPNSVRKEVFDTRALIKDSVLAVNTVQASLKNNTITGSSISEMTNQLAVKANVKGGFGKFKAEANASFDMNHTKNSNYEYASTYLDLDVRHASLNKSLEVLKNDYMTDDAWNDINGVTVTTSRGIEKVSYPTSNEGFKKLIEDYGTHVVMETGLGGRVRYSMSVDISNIKSSYDIKAFAKASYAGIVTAEASVDEKFKKSFDDHKNQLNIQVNVVGGDEALAKKLGLEGGFTKDNLEEWAKSVTKDNMALVSFSNKSLVPLYELVEQNATIEKGGFDGKKRYKELKKYLEKNCSSDFSTYDCGTVTKFKVPSFEGAAYDQTLIKDIVIDGQYVGQVCNEYIPNIDREHRVTVVYPMINNQACYNMGFFLGNRSHKPARVSWDGTDVHIEEYTDLNFGTVDSLYLRGASIMAKLPDGTIPMEATAVKDEFLTGLHYSRKKLENITFNCPLVKVFDKIWTRINYNQCVDENSEDNKGRYYTVKMDGKSVDVWNEYYSKSEMPRECLQGWRVANLEDYTKMNDKLVANGYSLPGLALQNGGVTGFELYYVGYFENTSWDGSWQESDEAILGTNDSKYIAYHKNGSVRSGDFRSNLHNIRLVKSN